MSKCLWLSIPKMEKKISQLEKVSPTFSGYVVVYGKKSMNSTSHGIIEKGTWVSSKSVEISVKFVCVEGSFCYYL